MKRSVRSVILVAVVIAAASPSPAFADASGRAQDVNVVRICAGQAIDLDDANGLPLPVERQQSLRDHAEFRCAHPELASRGSSSTASSPEVVHVDSDGYYPVANLDIQPGQVTWLATVGGMPVGPYKTLSCEWRIDNGAWQDCGTASGSGSGLRTRTNQYCPFPGLLFEVEAFLHVNGVDYFDNADGITQ
ncbi:hypothetical protein ITJ44_09715 [Clavibacter sp. VKM Ac-2873]|uniref:hypothetical protein n=1 Tax=Clavibacter sp. VKM Ac-2873 TaxID=2783813 RepID=UPI00188D84CE|nr:hypothetical protein [Clavibacter sp. VKM Ac-2873]MBF4618348.1 hypothetical protein [Clavibacter sp. VKM Ac-2873]